MGGPGGLLCCEVWVPGAVWVLETLKEQAETGLRFGEPAFACPCFLLHVSTQPNPFLHVPPSHGSQPFFRCPWAAAFRCSLP